MHDHGQVSFSDLRIIRAPSVPALSDVWLTSGCVRQDLILTKASDNPIIRIIRARIQTGRCPETWHSRSELLSCFHVTLTPFFFLPPQSRSAQFFFFLPPPVVRQSKEPRSFSKSGFLHQARFWLRVRGQPGLETTNLRTNVPENGKPFNWGVFRGSLSRNKTVLRYPLKMFSGADRV